MIEFILEQAPNAHIWLRFNSSPPKRWIEIHSHEMLTNAYGKQYAEPSLASDSYDLQLGVFVEKFVSYCERQLWANRVIGYLVYPLGEGTTQLTCEGFLFDQSPAMQKGFRKFLSERYRSDAALQKAWSRPDITLASAELPNDIRYRKSGEVRPELMAGLGQEVAGMSHRMHWPEPSEMVPERDYCLAMREFTERNFRTLLRAVKRAAPKKLAGLDAFKQSMLGWPLMARWSGDYAAYNGSMHAVSGAFQLADLLDMPELDVVATPHCYLHRGMGFPYEGEGIGDSVVLRNKMMFMEEDQRTYCLPSQGELWNKLNPGPEVPAGLWRNFATSITRGYNTYPMDVVGPSFFSSEEIQDVLRERRRVQEETLDWKRAEVPSVVMVLDDSSVLDEDLTIGYQTLAVIRQWQYGLPRCGVPYRIHLLEDLDHKNFPKCHKVFLFPNLFRLTPERIESLRKTVLRDGNIAIFGPATGITDGTRLRADLASELLGIPLELRKQESPRLVTIDRFDHPITAALPQRIDFGDSYAYGPLLVPLPDPAVQRLGGIQWPSAHDGAGLVIREFGRGAAGNGTPGPREASDYAIIFSAAVPLPAPLLREVARYSGTHIYSESDDLIFADGCTLGIHSVRPGKRTFRLPHPATVRDVITNRMVSEGANSITLDLKAPDTRLLHLENLLALIEKTQTGL